MANNINGLSWRTATWENSWPSLVLSKPLAHWNHHLAWAILIIWAPAMWDSGSHYKWTPSSNYPAFSVQSSRLADWRSWAPKMHSFGWILRYWLTRISSDLFALFRVPLPSVFARPALSIDQLQPANGVFEGVKIFRKKSAKPTYILQILQFPTAKDRARNKNCFIKYRNLAFNDIVLFYLADLYANSKLVLFDSQRK